MQLVKGYLEVSSSWENETLYAVYPDGTVYQTDWIKRPNDEFNKIGRVWFKSKLSADFVQDRLEFCGNYRKPV